jgi:hypothetical protein
MAKSGQSDGGAERSWLRLEDVDMSDVSVGGLAIEIARHVLVAEKEPASTAVHLRPAGDGRLTSIAVYLRMHMRWYRALKQNIPTFLPPDEVKSELQGIANLARQLDAQLRGRSFEVDARLDHQITKQHERPGRYGPIFPRKIMAETEMTIAALEIAATRAAESIEKGRTGKDTSIEDALLDAIVKAWEMASGHTFVGTKRASGGTEIAFTAAMLKVAEPGLGDKGIASLTRKLQPAPSRIRAAQKV